MKTLVAVILICLVLPSIAFLPGPSNLAEIVNGFGDIFLLLCLLSILLFIPGIIVLAFECIDQFTKSKKRRFSKAAIYLTVVPASLVVSIIYVQPLFRKMSIKTAISNAEPLIKSIDKYYALTGSYPDSLEQVYTKLQIGKVNTGIVGIGDYYYQKLPNNYTIAFYQPLLFGLNADYVAYNNLDLIDTTLSYTDCKKLSEKKWRVYLLD